MAIDLGINQDYFANPPVQVTGLDEMGVGVPADVRNGNLTKLTYAINIYQPQYLKELLGSDLYDAFEAGLQENPVPAKWTALSDKLRDDTTKISPIANYIFFNALRDWRHVYSGIGASDNKADNSNPVSVTPLQVNAWNVGVPLSVAIAEWLIANSETYEVDDICYPTALEWDASEIFEYKNRFDI